MMGGLPRCSSLAQGSVRPWVPLSAGAGFLSSPETAWSGAAMVRPATETKEIMIFNVKFNYLLEDLGICHITPIFVAHR
jgi:hypothetical protein